ncbi:MAG: hypothetical protein NTU44_05090, partial [Bacteroidetes bacterium]|nr:hypothetical protein [Bacteroidota bacterium]
MNKVDAYTPHRCSRGMHQLIFKLLVTGMIVFTLLHPWVCYSHGALPAFDEIPVNLNIKGICSMEVDAMIRGKEIYLPVTEIFTILKINNHLSVGMDSVSGFFINPDANYVIDGALNRIYYDGKIIFLEEEDVIKTETNFYLSAKYFGDVFGLECRFDFRNLTVFMETTLELPLIR